jgi:hypothetical protein
MEIYAAMHFTKNFFEKNPQALKINACAQIEALYTHIFRYYFDQKWPKIDFFAKKRYVYPVSIFLLN